MRLFWLLTLLAAPALAIPNDYESDWEVSATLTFPSETDARTGMLIWAYPRTYERSWWRPSMGKFFFDVAGGEKIVSHEVPRQGWEKLKDMVRGYSSVYLTHAGVREVGLLQHLSVRLKEDWVTSGEGATSIIELFDASGTFYLSSHPDRIRVEHPLADVVPYRRKRPHHCLAVLAPWNWF